MIFNLTISENASNSELYPKLFYPASSQYVYNFFRLNIDGNSHYTFFQVSNSLPYFIQWWLSVECKLVQNIKHITWIIFSSNNFKFPSDGDLIIINIFIILFSLFFDLIRIRRKKILAANFSNFWGSIWNFRTLMLWTMTSSDCNIFPFISFILFCFEKATAE